MEKLNFTYPATKEISNKIHTGVVASGDLEIFMFPTNEHNATVEIITGSDGFSTVWGNVLARFFERYPIKATLKINDFGATPGVVYLRLTQAMEAINDVEK